MDGGVTSDARQSSDLPEAPGDEGVVQMGRSISAVSQGLQESLSHLPADVAEAVAVTVMSDMADLHDAGQGAGAGGREDSVEEGVRAGLQLLREADPESFAADGGMDLSSSSALRNDGWAAAGGSDAVVGGSKSKSKSSVSVSALAEAAWGVPAGTGDVTGMPGQESDGRTAGREGEGEGQGQGAALLGGAGAGLWQGPGAGSKGKGKSKGKRERKRPNRKGKGKGRSKGGPTSTPAQSMGTHTGWPATLLPTDGPSSLFPGPGRAPGAGTAEVVPIEAQMQALQQEKKAREQAMAADPSRRTAAQLDASASLPWAKLAKGGRRGLLRHLQSTAVSSGAGRAAWAQQVRQRSDQAVHDPDAVTSARIVAVGERRGGMDDLAGLEALEGGTGAGAGIGVAGGPGRAESRLLQAVCERLRVDGCAALLQAVGGNWHRLRLELEAPAREMDRRRTRLASAACQQMAGGAAASAAGGSMLGARSREMLSAAEAQRRHAASVLVLLRSAGPRAGDRLLSQLDRGRAGAGIAEGAGAGGAILSAADLLSEEKERRGEGGDGSGSGGGSGGGGGGARLLDLHGARAADGVALLRSTLGAVARRAAAMGVAAGAGTEAARALHVVTGRGSHSRHLGVSALRGAVQGELQRLRDAGAVRFSAAGSGAFDVRVLGSVPAR